MESVLADDGQAPWGDVRAAPVDHEDPGQEVLEDEEHGPLGLAVEGLCDLLQAGVSVESQRGETGASLTVAEVKIRKT